MVITESGVSDLTNARSERRRWNPRQGEAKDTPCSGKVTRTDSRVSCFFYKCVSGIETQLIIIMLVKGSQFRSSSHRLLVLRKVQFLVFTAEYIYIMNNACPRKAGPFTVLMLLAAGNAASIVKAIALSNSIHHRNVPQIQYIGSRGRSSGFGQISPFST